MPTCSNCGAENTQGVRFCQTCGAVIRDTPTRAQIVPYKNPATAVILAAVLGILLMGVGQFYVNRFVRGIIILILGLVTGIVFFVAALGGFFEASVLIAAVVGSFRLALWAWQTYDAHKLARTYDEAAKETGKPPW